MTEFKFLSQTGASRSFNIGWRPLVPAKIKSRPRNTESRGIRRLILNDMVIPRPPALKIFGKHACVKTSNEQSWQNSNIIDNLIWL